MWLVKQMKPCDNQVPSVMESTEETNEFSVFGIFVKKANLTTEQLLEKEVRDYFNEPDMNIRGDPLEWWREKRHQYPHLAKLARKYLAVPATSAPSERVWSIAGNIKDKKRSCLKEKLLNELLFLHNNLQ